MLYHLIPLLVAGTCRFPWCWCSQVEPSQCWVHICKVKTCSAPSPYSNQTPHGWTVWCLRHFFFPRTSLAPKGPCSLFCESPGAPTRMWWQQLGWSLSVTPSEESPGTQGLHPALLQPCCFPHDHSSPGAL